MSWKTSIKELVIEVKIDVSIPTASLSGHCDLSWTWIGMGAGCGLTRLSSRHRRVYEILSTFITSGMRFLLNQQV